MPCVNSCMWPKLCVLDLQTGGATHPSTAGCDWQRAVMHFCNQTGMRCSRNKKEKQKKLNQHEAILDDEFDASRKERSCDFCSRRFWISVTLKTREFKKLWRNKVWIKCDYARIVYCGCLHTLCLLHFNMRLAAIVSGLLGGKERIAAILDEAFVQKQPEGKFKWFNGGSPSSHVWGCWLWLWKVSDRCYTSRERLKSPRPPLPLQHDLSLRHV